MNAAQRKGFTLIELMVVISVIGILSMMAMFGFAQAQKSGRDAQRKAIVVSLRAGLECYYNINGFYPGGVNFADIQSSLGAACINRNPTIPTGGILTTYTGGANAYTITLSPETAAAAINWYNP